MYFETGQGSELSSLSHFGADQLTMEARCYALAQMFQSFFGQRCCRLHWTQNISPMVGK
jgi:ethanolamine ammonia-lyase large subunit